MSNPLRPYSSALGKVAVFIGVSLLTSCANQPVQQSPSPQRAEKPTTVFEAVEFTKLPGWQADDQAAAWPAFLRSCAALQKNPAWHDVCAAAAQVDGANTLSARAFFETHFSAYRIINASGEDRGLLTGYYEPILRGTRHATASFRYPVYGVPDDLIDVNLAEIYPELVGMRLRGRIEGRQLVPYAPRSTIDSASGVKGQEIVWLDDRMAAFFMEVQGSARIELIDGQKPGETIRLGYADQNGYPYRAIGRWLVEQGELPLEKVSMQSITEWARSHPERIDELLDFNPSVVFFREIAISDASLGPPGSLGVPLSPGRSIAVDRRSIPLGSPVYIASTNATSESGPRRLTLAQDTGGAIAITARQPVRADLFFGSGDTAAEPAGHLREPIRAWLLLPKDMAPPGEP